LYAYLSGDCVEVMACSDNVVRAGLTPKYKDVATLTGMLTYAAGRPRVLRGEPGAGGLREYAAPVPEFLLQRFAPPPGAAAVAAPPVPSAAILLVVSGKGTAVTSVPPAAGGASSPAAAAAATTTTQLSEGQVWLQPFGVELALGAAPEGGDFVVFRAHTARETAGGW